MASLSSYNINNYHNAYTGTTQVDQLQENQVSKVFKYLQDSKPSTTVGHNMKIISKVGNTYEVPNNTTFDAFYNLQDVIAVAKGAGYTNTQIAKALEKANVNIPGTDTSAWDNTKVQTYNISFNQGTVKLQNYLSKNYSALNPYVSVITTDGASSYKIRIVYTDPYTHKKVYKEVAGPKNDINYTDAELRNMLGPVNSELGKELFSLNTHQAGLISTANKQIETATAIENALKGIGTVNSFNNLTDEERAAIKGALPGTENLTALNKVNNSNISEAVSKGLASNTIPELIGRRSLNELQRLANADTDLQLDITNRNITNQQQQLLQQLRNDPELYQAITAQLRADNAAGTIAGQRAANAQQFVNEANATYDTSAADLYKSLFTGDTAVAKTARDDSYTKQTQALDQYYTAALNNMAQAARQGQISQQAFADFVSSLEQAMLTDQARYADAVAEEQAAASGKATNILDRITGNVDSAIAANDAKLSGIASLTNQANSYLNKGADGSADISAAIDVIKNAIASGQYGSGTRGYGVVSAGDYDTIDKLNNNAYNAIINSEAFQKYLDPNTINELIEVKSIDKLKQMYGLDDLSTEGISALLEDYAQKANEQSNQVFNKAQRAYIAAVTAGDVKTTDQLTRLATNAGASKGNLYATSALANQFKQQFGLNNTGRQLTTDYLNQIASNAQNILNAQGADTEAFLNKHLGNGADNYNQGTFYGNKNLFDQTSLDYLKGYNTLNNASMSGVQNINSTRVTGNIDSYNRLNQIASGITGANLKANVNNITNEGTKKSYLTEAQAMKAQGLDTLNKYNRK